MQERFAVGLSLVCAASVLFAALYAAWDFPTTLIGTLAALLGGLIAGRVIGGIGAKIAAGKPAETAAPEAGGSELKKDETKEKA